MSFRTGNHIVHRDQPAWGIGRVVGVSADGLRLAVRFSGRPREELQVATRDPGLVRHRFRPGDEVKTRDGDRVVKAPVLSVEEGELDELVVALEDGEHTVSEAHVAAMPPASGVMQALVRGEWGDAKNFQLRQSTLRLDVERRCDGLGALFASRVMVRPYQVAVAQRVLSDRSPRYVLADEVGLGKTIEAGMITSALLHARLARRVLVVAPAHLSVQWLAELWHKFNLRFTLLDRERLEAEENEFPDEDPWQRYDLVVTSLELLARNADAREGAGDSDARWDLVIFDEAHHLRGERAYDVAVDLATNSWGLLLLTATPLKLDPEEYYRLLRLVESAPAQSMEDFDLRVDRQRDLTRLVRALTDAPAKEVAKQAAKVAALFPTDEVLQSLAARVGDEDDDEDDAREALLDHVAEVYSLSARLMRNRRAMVGGFTERRLHRIDVVPDEEERALSAEVQAAVHAGLAAGTIQQGAPLGLLLRRLDSSPAALAKALESRPEPALRELGKRARALCGLSRDARLRALRDRLRDIERNEPGAKVLVFTESRETLEYLVSELQRERFGPLWYHGDLNTLDRDRMVARFRDPDGPRLLISTEAGGEGRNFQFCHWLINYDLPWSPAAIEQRIGRLDRVGQTHPVEIVVFQPQGTLAARVVDLFADDVRVFSETVGGLDAVLEEVEGELVRLASTGGDEAWRDFSARLSAAVRRAREATTEDYDPLLDRRSFDRERVGQMLGRALTRAGLDDEDLDLDTQEGLEEALLTVARDLDERLEDTVLEIARRVGIEVDTDENVEAFQCRLTLGSQLVVDALAGIDLSEERVVEGTFWRDTAVEREEIEYLATGHPMVEALVNFVRDGDFGRASVVRLKTGRSQAVGACFSFNVLLPEPDDLAQGSHVPSRQAERLLESTLVRVAVELGSDGSVSVSDRLLEALDDAARPMTVRPADLPVPLSRWDQVMRDLERAAKAEAQRRLARSINEAASRLDRETRRRLDRLALDAQRGGGDGERMLRAAEMMHEQQFADAVRGALKACRLTLDSACGVFVEPQTPAARGRHLP